jgi:hypothetical protein
MYDEIVALLLDVDDDFVLVQSADEPVTGVFSGALIVNVPDVVLDDAVIDGDLIITEAVGEGSVLLQNVTVTGMLFIRGGGTNSVTVDLNSEINEVVVAREPWMADLNLQVSNEATIGSVVVRSGNIAITAVEGYLVTIPRIVVAPGATMIIGPGVSVGEIEVGEGATVIIYGTVDTITAYSYDDIYIREGADVEQIYIVEREDEGAGADEAAEEEAVDEATVDEPLEPRTARARQRRRRPPVCDRPDDTQPELDIRLYIDHDGSGNNFHNVAFPDQHPVFHNGVLMIPVNYVLRSLGFDMVEWEETNFQATFYNTSRGLELVFTVGLNVVEIGGRSHSLNVVVVIMGDRSMAPGRLFELLGYNVDVNECATTGTRVVLEPIITVHLDGGDALEFPDQQALIRNGTPWVPMLFLLDQFGYDGVWDDAIRRVTFTHTGGGMEIVVYIDCSVYVGGNRLDVSVVATIIGDRTMAPLELIQALESIVGFSAFWNESERRLDIPTMPMGDMPDMGDMPPYMPYTIEALNLEVEFVSEDDLNEAEQPSVAESTATGVAGAGAVNAEPADEVVAETDTACADVVESEPADTAYAEVADSEPVDAEAAGSESAEAEAVETESSDTESSDTGPSDTEFSDTGSSDSESSSAESSDSESSDTGSSNSESSDAGSSDSESSGSESSSSTESTDSNPADAA